MEEFVKGDIIVAPFPFSDLTSSIKRPALVIANLKGEDVILCQITSKEHLEDPYQIPITDKDILKGSLKIKSFIKPSIIFTVRRSILLYKIGRLSKNKIIEVENKICDIIKR